MSDFEVSISPTSPSEDRFTVKVVHSAAGEAVVSVELDTARIGKQWGAVQEVLTLTSDRSKPVDDETKRVLREIGGGLFMALLGSGGVEGVYRAAMAVAEERGQRFRLVIRTDSPRLARLPWEAMYDEFRGAYLGRRGLLVRQIPVASRLAPLRVDPPLRVLGVISSPKDLVRLDATAERQKLEQALAGPIRKGLIDLGWAPSGAWPDLQRTLIDGPWRVVHYIGHGSFDARLDEGTLALESEDTADAQWTPASRLVDLLNQAYPLPRLVVLNSCSGAVTGGADLYSGTATSLVRSGITAVVAMQNSISNEAAIAFSGGFYTALADGRGVDEAATSGRVLILGTSSATMEWVTPVLYLRGDQTDLFSIPPAARLSPIKETDHRIHVTWDPQTGGPPTFMVPTQVPPDVARAWIQEWGRSGS